jgi:hypothetical protein
MELLAGLIRDQSKTGKDTARSRAVISYCAMVGATGMARAVSDERLSRELLKTAGAAPEESLFVKPRSRRCSSNAASPVVLSPAVRPPLNQDCSTIDHHGLPGAKSCLDQE